MITLRNKNTDESIRLVSGERGVFRAASLPAGTYEIVVKLQGFEPRTIDDFTLGERESKTLDIKLELATIQESATVIGRLPKASLEAVDLRRSSARDVGEALGEVNGISKVRKGGIANDVAVRGIASRDLNVLIDGERIYGACPNEMDPASFHVDFGEVDRIEVGKGPFDIRNQGSLGGVINVLTKRPQSGWHTGLSLASGSSRYINPTGTASFGSPRLSALAGFSFRRSDPYVDGAGARFTEATNYRPDFFDSDSFRVGTAWGNVAASPRSNHLMQLGYTYQTSRHVLYPYLMMDAVYDNSNRVNLGYRISPQSGWLQSLQFQGYYTDVDHWMTDEYRISSQNMARSYSMGTQAKTQTFGGRLEAAAGSFLFGAEAFRKSWNAFTEMAGMAYKQQASIPDVNIDTVGIYAGYGRAIGNRLRLDLAARMDSTWSAADAAKTNSDLHFAYNATRRTSVRDVFPSATARLSYRPAAALELIASVGSTVRVPDARERFFALKRAGTDWVGNPELKPSRNNGADLTAIYTAPGFSFETSLYAYFIPDYVTVQDQAKVNAVPGIMNSSARTYKNIDARMVGIEASVAYSLSSRIFLAGGVSYVEGTQIPNPNELELSRYLAEVPPLRTRASVRYDDGFFSTEVEGVYAGRQNRVDLDLKETPTAAYSLLNLKFGLSFDRFVVQAGIDNLFDKDYFEYLSFQRDPFRNNVRVHEPGRTIFLNLMYRY